MTTAKLSCLLVVGFTALAVWAVPLESGFANPPPETKPWVYWYWMDDNVSKEGITRDLEAMSRVGFGEALIGNISLSGKSGLKIKVLSEKWCAAASSPNQRYDALHLDSEPHGLPEWRTLTPAQRKDYLLLLRDTFQDVRTFLDVHNAQNIPVYADLPVWLDQVGNPVGWASTAERDAWFTALGQSLAGITLMAYERKTAASIENGVSWKLGNFQREARVGLEVSVGSAKIWPAFSDLLAMIYTQEQAGPPSRAVDIHDFVQFRDQVALATTLQTANSCRILVMGDSISVGYTDNPNWSVPYQFGFRSGLYTRLTNSGMAVQFVGGSPEPWDGRYGVPTNTPTLDLRAINQDHCEGYGGKKTTFILSHLASWLALDKPDILLLMIGINDIRSGSTAEPVAAEQNLSNIVSTVVSTAPNVRLIVAQITPRSTYTLGIVKYNTYIRDTLVPFFAAQGKHVTTVDQYSNLLLPGTTNIDTSLFANRINHPTAVGYDRMAQTWFAGIQALRLPHR